MNTSQSFITNLVFEIKNSFSADKTLREMACDICNLFLLRLNEQIESKVNFCAIFGLLDDTNILTLEGAAGFEPNDVPTSRCIKAGEGVIGLAIRNKKPIIEIEGRIESLAYAKLRDTNAHSFKKVALLAYPILRPTGEPVGVFVIGKCYSGVLSNMFFAQVGIIDILERLAMHISSIVVNAAIVDEAVLLRMNLENERRINDITRQFYGSEIRDRNLTKLMKAICIESMNILNRQNMSQSYYQNFLFYEYQDYLKRFVLSSYNRKPRSVVQNFRINSQLYKEYVQDGLIKCIESQTRISRELGKSPHVVRSLSENKIEKIVERLDAAWSPAASGTAFILPLFQESKPLGVVVFWSRKQNRNYINKNSFYTGPERRKNDLQLFRSLQILIASEYDRLKADEEGWRRIVDLENIMRALKEVILIEEKNEVLNHLAAFTAKSLNAEGCLIHLFNHSKSQLTIQASNGFYSNTKLKEIMNTSLSINEHQNELIVQIFGNQREFIANSCQQFRRITDNHNRFISLFKQLKSGKVLSYIGQPINNFGVIEVFNKSRIGPSNWSFFEKQDTITLRHICETISTVLQRMEATAAQVQLEKAKATDGLLLDLSHELRNPLYTSRIFLHNLRESLNGQSSLADESGAQQKLEIVERNIAKAQRILRSMQGFQQIMLQNNEDVVDLEKIIRIVLETNRSLCEQQDIVVASEFRAEAPYVLGDETLLNQVFTNLVANAVDAMPEGGKLTARLYEQDNQMLAEIEDNGTGIPDAIKDKVFEPFVTTKNSDKGTGLGLNLCRRIIKQYSGEIDFESEVGRGTKFFVTLPKHVKSAILDSEKQPTIQAQHKERAAPAIAEFAWSEPPQTK